MKCFILLLMLTSFTVSAQTTFLGNNVEYNRFEKADSLCFYGDSITLKVYPKQDSVIMIDRKGNISTWMTASTIINAESPTAKHLYFCTVFGGLENGIIIEYSYNPRTLLWGICITLEDSQLKDGMPLWRPFPPLRVIKKIRSPRVKPITAHG